MTGDQLEAVREGYSFQGPALELGALVVDGKADPTAPVRIPLALLNRHGLVAGATGTGKTKTLQVLAEQLSDLGVPVFLADIKGDVSGMAVPGEPNDKVTARMSELGQPWVPKAYPCEFFTLGGHGTGIPIRATITDFGPVLLAKVLGLTEVQASSLNLVFHFADNRGLPLLDLKDLRAVIQYLISDEGASELKTLGGLAKQTAGVLLRELIAFSDAGAEDFFGEPEFKTSDLLRTTADGKGIVSILELPGIVAQPELFSSFLMWLLAELFQELPEVGDIDKPRLVFFFDEAHLLFKDASKQFLEQITQTVRLIRSKGVGIFFVTQTPKDVNADVLAQLGNRVQHALRAYTPDDAKALKATASTFPISSYALEEVLTQLGTGEAIITVLNEKGVPTPVAWTRLRAPQSLMAQADASVLTRAVNTSPLTPTYATEVDRESAYEMLAARLNPQGGVGTITPEQASYPQGDPQAARPAPPAKKGTRAAAQPKAEPGMVEQVLGSRTTQTVLKSFAAAAGAAIARTLFGTARRRKR